MDWTELFQDPIIVTAILDRLLHHSVVINIKGNSYRLKGKMQVDGMDNLNNVQTSGSIPTTENGSILKDR